MSDGHFAGALLDLDGTVYLGDQLLPGADGAVTSLRDGGVSVLFLTNKAIERRETYCRKLTELGVPADEEDVITSGAMTAQYLATHHPSDPVFVVGEEPLERELEAAGLELTDTPEAAGVLLASMDRRFDYERLSAARRAVEAASTFIATNPDRTCPTETGEIPDCAAMVGAIEGASGRELERVIGKPSQTAIDASMDRLGLAPEQCLIVGDRLETDIEMGNRAGMTTVLVLTGVTDRRTVAASSIQPDHVIDSVADLGSVVGA